MPSVGFEPTTNRLCLPATTFAARFRFVVWTVSSLYESAVQSLHLPQN
jgi:ADP-glucose pyrophosphorylase